jgi:hypothetical protein
MKENPSESGRQFYIPIILTLITIVLGLISFHAVFPDYPFLRKLYYTFQLFSMESGDRFYDNGDQPLSIAIIFNIARFTAIAAIFATIFLAILSVLKYKFYQLRLWFIKGHTIICGFGNMGKAIADNFHDKRKLVVIEQDNSNEYLEKLQNEGAIIVEENAVDGSVLDKVRFAHARCLIALTGDDFDNLKITKYVLGKTYNDTSYNGSLYLAANIDSRNLKAAVTEEWQKNNITSESTLREKLKLFYDRACEILAGKEEGVKTRIVDTELDTLRTWLLDYDQDKDQCQKSMQNVILFNKNLLAARYLFVHYPPDRFRQITKPDDKAMNILMLGYSQIGEELLRLFAQNCHYLTRVKTRVTIVSLDGDLVEERIMSKYPNIRNTINLLIIKQNPHHMTCNVLDRNDASDVDVIYICSGEDRFQASYSSKARELFGCEIPIVRPFYQSTVLSEEEMTNNTWSLNILNKISNPDYIIDMKPDRKAIAIHNHWLGREIRSYLKEVGRCLENNEEIPVPKPTLEPWILLPGEVQDDNRSVVDHINIKLRSFGQLNEPRHYTDHKGANIDYSFLDDPQKVNQLAEMEHRRWMANKFLCGWEYGKKRDVKTKRHESLTNFEDLDSWIQEIDRLQIMDLKEIVDLE